MKTANNRFSVLITFSTCMLLLMAYEPDYAQTKVRKTINLNDNWHTVANDTSQTAFAGFEKTDFDDSGWVKTDIPHNWDQYEGFRRMKHGNRHGYAWYRKTFTLTEHRNKNKRYFLLFEGIGSYATVWLNGKQVGGHSGGRTTFTLDISDAINPKGKNILAVRADHPAFIADLPWVCGGCSAQWGFSEGSQPMGIFRPVHLIVTDPVRIEPFGVHIWNDDKISEKSAVLNVKTEIKNYGTSPRKVSVVNRLIDPSGKSLWEQKKDIVIASGATDTVLQVTPEILNPRLWSPESPVLYQVATEIREKGKVNDSESVAYGIRWISWPIERKEGGNQFLLNGKPVFINGTCEYEHLMGKSHAFTDQQIKARVNQIRAAGYNAFRDAHQPHNLLYQKYWDETGMLLWTQMSAQIWYDTPEFRENFKRLLRDWVKERRNSPSVVLWGLQNESALPEDFARECTEIIREMDPTTSAQRKVTTCNGGTGTDWNVVQNWSGTYGGDPDVYDQEISKQILNGEYGAWRSIDFHTEGPFMQKGPYSEDRLNLLMEKKIHLAEKVKDQCAGQFHWLFNSHENPGRVQNGEGYREIDKVGPVNYKGLVTPWEEPLDSYYMFRANYASKATDPMVYIVSHTWPDRWISPGIKDNITVFSNCDEVELFNDINDLSLGRKINKGIGTHFRWDSVNIQYNVLYVIGYVDGKVVAKDYIVLNHLGKSPKFDALYENTQPITAPQKGLNYIYRVNCGGPDYVEENGNLWKADVHKTTENTWGSLSWTDDYRGIPAFYASQRRTKDPIGGTRDWPLFQTFRYGMDKLQFEFPVPDGEYLVELYFNEPWYGTGGGMDCTGWRIFDVGINGEIVIRNLDIWKEAGHDQALKKTVIVTVKGGKLTIHFPKVTVGQGIIFAIAIASKNQNITAAPASPSLITELKIHSTDAKSWSVQSWLDTGDKVYKNENITFSTLPSEWYGAEWIQKSASVAKSDQISFAVTANVNVFVAIGQENEPSWLQGFVQIDSVLKTNDGKVYKVYKKEFANGSHINLRLEGTSGYIVAVTEKSEMDEGVDVRPMIRLEAETVAFVDEGITRGEFRKENYIQFSGKEHTISWDVNPGLAGTYLLRFRYMNLSENSIPVRLQIIAQDGRVMKDDQIDFPAASDKWRSVNTTTGTTINAGHYKIILTTVNAADLRLDAFEWQ